MQKCCKTLCCTKNAHCKGYKDFPTFLHYQCINMCRRVWLRACDDPCHEDHKQLCSKGKWHRIRKVLLHKLSAEHFNLLLDTENPMAQQWMSLETLFCHFWYT